MLKSEIYKKYETVTRQTYKNQPLYIGDVYQNNLGTKSIVLEENEKLVLVRENGCKFELPSQKSAFKDSEFVANVVQDIDLMNFWVEKGVIIEEEKAEVKKEEEPMVEETKEVIETPITTRITTLDGEINEDVVIGVEKEVKTKKSTKKEAKEAKKPTMNIYQKINDIRLAWANANVDKEGKGRAGGGAKYDYYKPQQIIDFCLTQELKHNLYSKFSVVDDRCFYQLTNLDNIEETETVACPFTIPKKMAASEAQQVGAAMTYHNRRLAMMMYKIEDNSKESIDVLENADYSKSENNAPNIPAPPIEPIAPKMPTSPVEPPKVAEVQKPIDAPKPPVNQNVATENEQKDDLPPWQANVKPIQVIPPTVPTVPAAVPPTVPAAQSVPSTPTNSIESLY